MTSNQDHFTAIVVDHSPEVAPFHIVYLGTDSGKVLKAVINATSSGKTAGSIKNFKPDETVITQSWELFPGSTIKTLKLASSRRLFVGTEIGLRIIPVDNCQQFNSCITCVGIRDPHCAWDLGVQQCVSTNYQTKNAEILQNINLGSSSYCPIDERNNEIVIEPNPNPLRSEIEEDEAKDCCPCTPVTTTSTSQTSPGKDLLYPEGVDSGLNVLPQDPIVENVQIHNETFQENEIPRLETGYTQDFKSSYVRSAEEGYVTNQSLVLATTSTAGVSLLIGFVLGFIVSKLISSRQTQKKPATNAQLAATMNESQRLTKPIDFVLNVPSANNKVPVKNNLNTGTLEKTVKKIYL
ncbi:Semaphorin-4E [Orchesella cincta]|uniref:Semaphorin-4E n=1 Tax=Orchesella cincta TaxID=48709 RepID=A0A1D2N2E3_ORCCI|nr:Semaphorin-4E [Orchesella cincta]